MSIRSGPLPPPDELAKYDQIAPGLAQLIVNKFSEQSDHRRELERMVVMGNEKRSNRGQWMAFTIAITAIAGGMALIALDKPTGGLVSIISAISGLAVVFIAGKIFQWKERQAKQESP